MTATIKVPCNKSKTVALVLNYEIEAWIHARAKERGVSNAVIAREIFHDAMKKHGERTKGAA